MALPDSIGELVTEAARRFGDKTAIVCEGRQWSFNALDRASDQLAASLQSLGIGAGDRVSLYAPNSAEWVIAYYAVLKIGGVVNPLNLMLTPQEAAYVMHDCGAVAVFGTAEKIAALAPVRGQTQLRHLMAYGGSAPAGALAFDMLIERGAALALQRPAVDTLSMSTIGYTSGTTGHPKGAMLTHQGILLNTAMTATMHLRSERDVVVSALPCSHVYGNIVMNAAIACGMTLVLHRNFEAGAILDSIEQHRATLFEGVPTMFMYLLGVPDLAQRDLSSLTRCTVGGQTMPLATMQKVEAAFGCPLLELWGMTELGGLGTTHSAHGPRRLGSIGVALPHMQARIAAVDDPARELPFGEVGELQMRGPLTMQGYFNRPEATVEVLVDGGWLRTGDLARMDPDGCIAIVDRLKDMVITAGFNIYPAELERAIAEHPDVAMVAVGSVPDADKGELAKAYIVLRPGAQGDAAAYERHCRERLAAYKVPRAFAFVAELPQTSSGKIMRRRLRELDA
jgi:long-chain acyl-CoA synthetase